MSSTTTTARASAPESPLPSGRQRANFARDCALDAFGRGAIHHLTSSNFVDRERDSAGDDEIVDGREAVARWLKLAANLEDGEAAQTAFQTADELRRVLGLSWADVLGRKAA